MLKALVEGGGTGPSLEDADTMTARDYFYLLATLDMAWGSYARLMIFLVTVLVQDCPNALAMQDINEELLEIDTELE